MVERAKPQAELFFVANNLVDKDTFSKSDPFLVLFSKTEDGQWVEVGRTDVIRDNLNPVWHNRFVIDYHFETVQEFKVQIYDEDEDGVQDLSRHELIGENTFKLGALMVSRGQRMTMQLVKASHGTVTIRAETAADTRDSFQVQFAADGLPNKGMLACLRTSDPYLAVSRLREDNTWLQVWKSNVVDSNLSPVWDYADISLLQLCNGDIDRPLKLEVFDQQASESVLMGHVQTTVRQLADDPSHAHALIQPDGCAVFRAPASLTCRSAQVKHYPTFMEYIKGGCQISLMVAIDFTASNGDPSESRSLHYVDPDPTKLNEYQQAIVQVGRVLDEYDTDKKYPVYGFGAIISKDPKNTSHCFFVARNGEKEALEVEGIDGILGGYKTCRNDVKFSGPTKFGPVLRAAMQRASAPSTQGNQQYHVLLIICDGEIHDMDETKEALVEASRLPLSVVIVGVGSANFKSMEVLDSDSGLLRAPSGATAARDIVQFVSFRKYREERPEDLAKEVLAEIPDQLLGFMATAGIAPNVPGGTVPSVEETKQNS